MTFQTKYIITEIVYNELCDIDIVTWGNRKIDDLMFEWWLSGRSGLSLRLTDEGMNAFSLANITYYSFELDMKLFSNIVQYEIFLKKMSKKLACPYYLGVKKYKENKNPHILLYDNKIAMLVSLYGSVIEYIDSVK